MAAPSSTVWGNTVSGSDQYAKGKIGIYTGVSSTSTQTKVNIQVWYWTMYRAYDSSNSYYYDADATTATTSRGSVSTDHPVSEGSGWDTANQTKLGEYNYTYNRGVNDAKHNYAAKFTGIDNLGSGNAMSVTTSITVPALATYTISYNANGGSGVPSSQTKWHGTNITLSTSVPHLQGHTFAGWATSASGSVVYAAGATYSANASVTLYAKWTAITYPVSYDANGGSGAPGNQTKTYGVNLTLSSTKPTRPNHNFIGWAATSGATTAAYSAGGTYTDNAAVTLYAVWELAYTRPRINLTSCYRCDSVGNSQEGGSYARIEFTWVSDKTVSSVYIYCRQEGASGWTGTSCAASGTSGSVSKIISGLSSADAAYNIKITVTDGAGSSDATRNLQGEFYLVDELPGGRGISFGKVAEMNNYMDVDLWALFRKQIQSRHSDCALRQDNSGRTVEFGIGTSGNLGIWAGSTYGWLFYLGSDLYTRIRSPRHIILETGSGWAVITYGQMNAYRNKSEDNARLFLADSVASSQNTGFHAKRKDTGVECWMGVGSGGANHGVYSEVIGGWLIFSSGSNTHIRAASGKSIFFDQNSLVIAKGLGIISNYAGGMVNALAISSDALGTYFGPPDVGSMASVTYLRGKTVRIYNHSGGAVYLGSSGSTAVTSDRNLKKDIMELGDKYIEFFSRLVAVTYKYNDHNNIGHRDHIGFIAQDVEQALLDSGLTTEQFAGICIETDVTIDKDYDTAEKIVNDYVPDPPVPKEDKHTDKEPVIDIEVKDEVAGDVTDENAEETVVVPQTTSEPEENETPTETPTKTPTETTEVTEVTETTESEAATEESSETPKEEPAEKKDTSVHYDKLYSLRYEEFIALNTHMIQRANRIIEKQQEMITKLEQRVIELEKLVARP